MRSGACTLQQTLTAEAASVLKHSLGLARRRGHAQVTPLHVAATLLSLRSSSLRRACLKTQPLHQTSHPLQCRALELCFNVALNRLPTTPAPNLLHTQQPSLSNALIAALKRAQAHQRRGCIEQQQQQPLLTIKVELEQLIISILDDPSVSRVMREAGFSSTAVKNNIEDSSSVSGPNSVFQCGAGVFSSPCSPSSQTHFLGGFTNSEYNYNYNPVVLFSSPQKKLVAPVYPITDSDSSATSFSKEDVKVVLDILLRKKKKNTVIVGDSVSLTEGLVEELKGKLERGEVPEELKSTHFIKLQFATSSSVSLRFMKRDEVEINLSELKRKVDSIVASRGGGAIFYVGDLKWTVEATSFNEKEDGEVSGYNPVDHFVAEIGKLFSDYGNFNNTKVWLMATASYQTYMRCQMREPPLETQWALQAVPVPSGGLCLSLHANSSVLDSKMAMSQNPCHMLETKLFSNKEDHDKLNCCEECASNYEKEAQLFKPGQKKLLPSWLQSHSTEAQQKDELTHLKRKWNRLCHGLHQSKQLQNQWSNTTSFNHGSNAKIYPYNSSYPWWPNQSVIFPDSSSASFAADSATKPTSYGSNLVPRFRRLQSCTTIEFNFSDGTQKKQGSVECIEEEGKEVKITLALGNSSSFGGSGQMVVENIKDRTMRRAHICKLLQDNVPWQSETIPSIAEALVDLDSKSAKRSCSTTSTWLFMQGTDSIGKTRLARAIAELVFGSVDMLLHLDMLKRENLGASPFSEILAGALKTHEKLVVLIENVDFADAQFMKFLANGFETEKFGTLGSSEEKSKSCQAIFILTNGGTGTRSNEEQNEYSVMRLVLQVSETKPTLETPCLGHKRRAELDLFKKIKNPRTEEKEDRKKEFSRQSSFNTLDLNMKADEEDDAREEYKTEENSPISSDLTRETMADPLNPNGFLDSIENRFEFIRSPARDREMTEMFLSKIKGSFEQICGKQNLVNFSVEERVIEEMHIGCGYFTNSMFERWLKDIFQSSLGEVNFGEREKEGIGFTLCWGGKGDSRKWDSGFMSSSLPKNIHVNYFMD